MMTPKPLADVECQDLLAQHELSVTIGALPVVVPVTYWYFRGSVILRTSDGPAYRAAVVNAVGLAIDADPHVSAPTNRASGMLRRHRPVR